MDKLNAFDFLGMIKSGAANLSNYAAEIDTLNVFPVPDGDTGTNMSMTFDQGVLEASKCESDAICDVAKALSKGLLMGARGNSGVITSQIFRGFYQAIVDKKEIDVLDVANAFENGTRVAYKAIMKPVEGTILTVVREASWYAKHDLDSKEMNIEEFFSCICKYTAESLDRTPDILPVLKEVGVVDSGGSGLLRILEGFSQYLQGNPVVYNKVEKAIKASATLQLENEEFGYCTEFIFRIQEDLINNFDENKLKNKLATMGESLVVVKDDDLVKVHVHTLKPGDVLNVAQRYGEFVKLKIENMQEQHSSILEANHVSKRSPRKKYALIAVAAGDGLVQTFKELGVDVVVSGGQSMNPSTQDFLEAVQQVNADNVFLFPNNSNIILAANQTKEMVEDCNVFVIESKSIPSGLSAIASFDFDAEVSVNINTCNEIISNLKYASITYAIKDTSFEGVEVKKDDYIAMANKSIISSGKDIKVVIKELLEKMAKESTNSSLSVIAGEGSNQELNDYIEALCNDLDFDLSFIEGNQPVYTYLFGLE